eukprot:Sspe_Gene.53280::Locus_29471_Transcript_1_1_Confidence_1.000_Length_961::g.53280::m.53280
MEKAGTWREWRAELVLFVVLLVGVALWTIFTLAMSKQLVLASGGLVALGCFSARGTPLLTPAALLGTAYVTLCYSMLTAVCTADHPYQRLTWHTDPVRQQRCCAQPKPEEGSDPCATSVEVPAVHPALLCFALASLVAAYARLWQIRHAEGPLTAKILVLIHAILHLVCLAGALLVGLSMPLFHALRLAVVLQAVVFLVFPPVLLVASTGPLGGRPVAQPAETFPPPSCGSGSPTVM